MTAAIAIRLADPAAVSRKLVAAMEAEIEPTHVWRRREAALRGRRLSPDRRLQRQHAGKLLVREAASAEPSSSLPLLSHRGLRGLAIPSCRQIPRTRPGPISRWRGTNDLACDSEFSHASWGPVRPEMRTHPCVLRCRSRSRRFTQPTRTSSVEAQPSPGMASPRSRRSSSACSIAARTISRASSIVLP